MFRRGEMGFMESLTKSIKGMNEPLSFLIAIIVISFSLTNAFTLRGPSVYVLAYVVAVSIGVIVHELTHKFVGIRYGCPSRFYLDPLGLLVTIVTSILPLHFIAVGYTAIVCPRLSLFSPSKYDKVVGISATAGPISNLIISSLSYLILATVPLSYIITFFLYVIGGVNSWLALFNLIPFGPLDGLKTIKWNFFVWLILFIISLLFSYLFGII